jgi:BirA family transcriptional regulator, biotin operon repressor / biotin---[acetyl-CoA-carboxylase] ligase
MPFTLGRRAASAGYRLQPFDQIGSTSVEALVRAREGERGSVWFVTTEQTAGRGRRQRPWIAPRGNLASSVLEVMDVAPALAATLGFASGLAIEAALQSVSTEAMLRSAGSERIEFSLKWPNDVVVGGQKLVGIGLDAEAVADGRLAVVVGIGTNVVAAPEGTPTPAISLAALGIRISAEELFSALSDAWVEFFGIWDNGRGFKAIRELWLSHAAGLGRAVAVTSGGSTIEGIFDTIDEQGCMIIHTPSGMRMPVSAGDVYFGSAASRRTS